MSKWSQPLVEKIWRDKYRHGDEADREQSFARVCSAVYERDEDQAACAEAFEAMKRLEWCPAGRIQAGAGTGNRVTLINCFVTPTLQDSMETEDVVRGHGSDLRGIRTVELDGHSLGIMDALKISALTQQQGGGIGVDFSPLRPRGATVHRTGSTASGPLAFMDMWNAMCETVMSAGHRRGAMMAILRCDHPDVEEFIEAKRTPGRLINFNVSVAVTDAFMEAVKNDRDWYLLHDKPKKNMTKKSGNGDGSVVARYVYKVIRARKLWDLLLRNTYEHAEPGVVFIDRINDTNNLRYLETIAATNPCGEQPLPPDGDCCLGAVNLAVLVRHPFTERAEVDWERLYSAVHTGVRFLDNVLDVTHYPTEAQRAEALAKRRIGLGITGLANMLQQLCLRYGSAAAFKVTHDVMREIAMSAYEASTKLAQERGPFPGWNADRFFSNPRALVHRLPQLTQALARKHGLRNGVLLTVAPTGTTSIYYDNVSSGLEPVFAHRYTRNVRVEGQNQFRPEEVYDWGYLAWCKHVDGPNWSPHTHDTEKIAREDDVWPDYMVTADELTVEEHLQMQAACQQWVDASISKTINCPADMTFDDFKKVYDWAYKLGLKGCTTYRPNPASGRGAILQVDPKPDNVRGLADTAREELSGSFAGGDAAPTLGLVQEPVQAKVGRPKRPELLPGLTMKVRWPSHDHAHYVTLSTHEGRPFEVFISSMDVTHRDWEQGLSRILSAMLQLGIDAGFILDELAEVHSPAGGHLMKEHERYVPSFVAYLALTIKRLIESTRTQPTIGAGIAPGPLVYNFKATETYLKNFVKIERQCPKCYQWTLVRREGCDACTSCDYNKCG